MFPHGPMQGHENILSCLEYIRHQPSALKSSCCWCWQLQALQLAKAYFYDFSLLLFGIPKQRAPVDHPTSGRPVTSVFTKRSSSSRPLPDSVNLPSARRIWQSPICTRQRLCRVLHSVKKESAKTSLPSVFYRALGKAFAEC